MKIVMKTLDELGSVRRGKSKHRPRDASHLYDGPYPFIQTSDVKNAGLYITDYTQTYSAAGLAQSKLWKTGTLCITIAANIGDASILSFDACFPDSIIGFISDPQKSDARYIKYLFDAVLQKSFKRFTQGSAQDNLSQEKLLSLKLPVTEDVQDQILIADILSSYDDLIDTNRRRIQLLEEAARLLFREWFVYFRFPGYEKVKIVDGVPEGWKKEKIKKILTLEYGKSLVADKRENGDIPVYGSSGVIGFHNKALIKGPGVIVGRAGNAGSVHWVNDDFFPVDSTFYVKTKMNNMLLYFYYYLSICHLERFISGSAVPGLNRNIVYSSNVLLPETNIVEKFNELADQINKQCFYLRSQNQKLAQARDLLLPRLMNGAIEV